MDMGRAIPGAMTEIANNGVDSWRVSQGTEASANYSGGCKCGHDAGGDKYGVKRAECDSSRRMAGSRQEAGVRCLL